MRSNFDAFESSGDEIGQKQTELVHNPMTAVHPVDFTAFMLHQVVRPFIPRKLERLSLAVDVNHRSRWSISVEEQLLLVQNTLEHIFPQVEVRITSGSR